MRPIPWEYQLEPTAALDTNRLNELGQQGWELVAVLQESGKAVFKRPGPDYRERITLEQRAQVERERQEGDR